jgi:hypothetical protein
MRVPGAEYWPVRIHLISTICVLLLLQPTLRGQPSYRVQVRGVVSGATGAVLPNATVTITEVGTNVSQIAKTGSSGDYILRALRPSTYLVKVTAPGFQTVEQKGVVLAVEQATTLKFTLRPAGTSTMIQGDRGSAAAGHRKLRSRDGHYQSIRERAAAEPQFLWLGFLECRSE